MQSLNFNKKANKEKVLNPEEKNTNVGKIKEKRKSLDLIFKKQNNRF